MFNEFLMVCLGMATCIHSAASFDVLELSMNSFGTMPVVDMLVEIIATLVSHRVAFISLFRSFFLFSYSYVSRISSCHCSSIN